MNAAPPQPETDRAPGQPLPSPARTVLLAVTLGVCGGYLDLVVITAMKYGWNDLQYFWIGSDFPWSVPVGHAVLLGVVGTLLAIVNAGLPGRPITMRAGTWLLVMLAVWWGLLRSPLYGAGVLLLAGGLARPLSAAVTALCRRARLVRYVLAGIWGLLIVLAALSSGLRAVQTYRASTGLPEPARGARNVVLIVWDTVRAPSVSLYGYDRDNTPNLRRLAQRGVRYTRAVAPAPWTYPSHSSFFTGRWPYQLDTQWNSHLDTPDRTLAEYLASHGYQTAGFSANTRCCTYETGLDRGFAHFEDYPMTFQSLLSRTAPGSWLVMNLLNLGNFYEAKWINFLSRDASALNDAFLAWLENRQRDRPFFAFLNYYDAHSPYVPPPKYAGRFGRPLSYPEDYQLLFNLTMEADDPNWERNMTLARDCYDDCIASLDEQLGRLMAALRRARLLDDTLVIIAGDHGESFGDHYLFSHGTGLYVDQIVVPLVILSPEAPAGLKVTTPVSLRDLPATVVDQLRLSSDSPFPGRSLAAFWTSPADQPAPTVQPALSELVGNAQKLTHRGDPSRQGFQMSLMSAGWHYLRDSTGGEQIFDMSQDIGEQKNLASSAEAKKELDLFRRTLLDMLTSTPGSITMENTYLKPFRQALKALVDVPRPPTESATASVGTLGVSPSR